MALQTHFLSSFTNRASHFQHTSLFFSSTQPCLTVRSQNSSEFPKPITNLEDTAPVSATPKKTTSPGVGFGSSSSSPLSSSNSGKTNANTAATSKRKQRGKRERASIIRRSPVEKPAFVSEKDEGKAKEQGKNESAFLLAWLGFGAVILAEGIVLAASGFLPEEWDKFFVKYLYPSFTPTVFLFVAGTIAYGVFKYLQNEKITGQK